MASAGLHLTLLAVFFFGSGFLASRNKLEVQMIEFVPMIRTDANISGGGTPDAKPPAANPQPPTPKPEIAPKPPEPVPVAKPEPTKTPVHTDKPDPRSLETKPEKKPSKPEPNMRVVVRNNSKPPKPTTTPSTESDTQARAEAQRRQIVGSTVRSLRENLSPGASVQMPKGPGGGGPSYASYYMEVQRICKQRYDAALLIAGDIAQEQTSLEAAVTIARDGTVLSAKMVKPSSNATLNKLVLQRVLDANFPAFPEGATDSQRTINIIFDLKPKKAIG